MHSEGVSLKTISKGFIPDKLSELSKPLPDKIREVIAFGGWYGSNVKSLSTYLASILLLQTFAVILTVVVLDLYFSPEDKPLPGYLQSVIRVLSCNCCKSHSAVVTPEPDTDYYDSQRSEKKSLRRSVASIDGWISPSPTPSTMSCGPLGWKEAARVLDRAFLYLYLIAVIAITGVCMGIMWWHFNADYH